MTSTVTDRYPTRAIAKPTRIPRHEPVVWRSSLSATPARWVSREHVARFERDGFLFLPGFFAEDEVAMWHSELIRLQAFCAEHYPDEAFMEAGSSALRSLFHVQKFSKLFRGVARDPRIVDFVRYILDDEVYLHQSRVNYKGAFSGKEFFWHSDFETWHAEDGMPRMRAISASIVLTPSNAVNGALMLLPGSHRHFIGCVGATPDAHFQQSLVRQEIGIPDTESLAWLTEQAGGVAMPAGPAGSLLLFDCNTMHGSNSNISPYPRSNLFFVYNAVSNRMQAPFAAPRPRPEFLGARKETSPLN